MSSMVPEGDGPSHLCFLRLLAWSFVCSSFSQYPSLACMHVILSHPLLAVAFSRFLSIAHSLCELWDWVSATEMVFMEQLTEDHLL